MPDDALSNALAELQFLQDEIARADAQIARLSENKNKMSERLNRARGFVIAWHEFAGLPKPVDILELSLPEEVIAHKNSRPSNVTRIANNPKKEIVAIATLQLVNERGHPIPRPELRELLASRGLDVRGADPLVTLSTMLWRAGPRVGLLHLKGYGYWDGTKPYEPAGYAPGTVVIDELDQNTIDSVNNEDAD